MACEDERLEDITIGDDIVRQWEFFESDSEGRPTDVPADLSNRTYRSQIRYVPGDPVAHPFSMSVAANIVTFQMLRDVSSNLPVGDLYWDLEETNTTTNLRRVIKRGRVLTHPRITV